MNELLIQFGVAALLRTVKNPERRAAVRDVCRELVKGVLLAYEDDPTFFEDE